MLRPRVTCCVLALAVAAVSAAVQAETISVCFRSETGLYLVQRELPEGTTPLVGAAQALAAGPTADEQANGIWSAIPAGTQLQQAVIEGDTVVVDFSAQVVTDLDEVKLSDLYDQVKTTYGLLNLATNVRVTSGGQSLASYLPPVVEPKSAEGQAAPIAAAEPVTAGALSGHSLTLSPGHGWVWTGSAWTTERPVYCSPLNNEDFHTDEIAAYLKTFLEQDGMVVRSVRCVDKNYGNEPLSGNPGGR